LTPDDLYATVKTLIAALGQGAIEGKLWTVERHRIREYLPEKESPDE
jgi:hypothetical protein